jgi:uncharacterized protein YndB with AHSA1/START domain
MSVPESVDTSAPVVVRHEITISAARDRVWKLHVDINNWTEWQHDVTDANLDVPLARGAAFTWTSFGFSVTSTVFALDPESRILWGGESGGIMGIHEWTFQTTPTGTRVRTTESFSGEPVDHAADELRQQLDFSLGSWLTNLKIAAETD